MPEGLCHLQSPELIYLSLVYEQYYEDLKYLFIYLFILFLH